jgi:hypothetical protein
MVCVACFVMPVCIWLWFEFLMPILFKLKSLLFKQNGDKQEEKVEGEEVTLNETKMKCPFKTTTTTTTVDSSLPNEVKSKDD